MPNKTIYVAESDLPLFERAARLGGGLSPAVAAAVRAYVQREGSHPMPATDIIEVEVTDGLVTRRQRFRGRKLITLVQRHDLRRVRYTAYATAKEQFAVYIRDEPDWSRLSAVEGAVWEDPRTWDEDFYATGERRLAVFPRVDAMVGELPDDVVSAIRGVESRPDVEDLEI